MASKDLWVAAGVEHDRVKADRHLVPDRKQIQKFAQLVQGEQVAIAGAGVAAVEADLVLAQHAVVAAIERPVLLLLHPSVADASRGAAMRLGHGQQYNTNTRTRPGHAVADGRRSYFPRK